MCSWMLMAQAGQGFTAVDAARRPMLKRPCGRVVYYPTVAGVQRAVLYGVGPELALAA